MLKMMIVDDEPRTLDGIRRCLQWNELNIRIVAQASNGRDAINLAGQLNPDIVLTDIRMPIIDGIALSKMLKKNVPQTKVIFITGYMDSVYMKSAFKVGIVDYILKPIDIQELEHTIRKTAEICLLEKMEEQRLAELESRLRESLPLMQKEFLEMLVLGEIGVQEDILERLESLELDIPQIGSYLAVSIHLDDNTSLKKQYSALDIQRLSKRLLREIKAGLDGSGSIVFELYECQFVVLLHESEPDKIREEHLTEKFKALAIDIQSVFHETMRQSVTIGIGHRVDRLEDLKDSYYTALHEVNQKLSLYEEDSSLYAARQGSNSYKVVERLKSIMHERFAENLSIELLANEVFVSPPHICLLFKKVTGETINGYLTRIRIEEAKRLLTQGTKKLFEVCLEVGYTDPKYFSKLFKKHTGMNPSDFKRV
ncbi:two-component system, response regulator YesN [Paenibacillus catalpae]|uniref:Two-component system, response regulator YesN n=2 Tax=Paenibacillus catalpae TaxID=1045775 RepID=A0A1I1TVX3_9BACL|nr:two-component system, response regulator YesN [Paenibacillus catalpae]